MAEKLTIFISGTMRDLPTERERVAATIRDMNLEPVWAEKRGATDRPSRDECERMARICHVYLGLYGLSYGWKFPPDETISATEFEWQMAKRADRPMLIYRQKGQPELDQAAFLKRVGDWQRGRFWYEFETLDDLLPRLRNDLARLIAESFRPERLADLADYRAHLRRLYADLPLSGIPVPLDVTLPLDRVYIKLRALPEQEEAARRAAALPPDHGEDLPRKLAERLWRQREREELEDILRLKETQPIPPEEAIAQHDRLAVLGEAGAGKSTLLRHLAWERAGDSEAPLPFLVPLGRADALISQTGCSFLEAALDMLTEHKAGEEREALKQGLTGAIRDKKVLFLCDGLDEAHLARRSVVAGLEKLVADGQRLVVTSRPLGYERLAGLEHFQVLPLLPEDARDFSERWFLALAQARGVPEAEREGWATERAGWLQRQLDERPGLQEVARNPLLLTFLAVLAGDEPQRDLPPRRKELYREYVERLFTVWEARRRREGELALGRLRGEEACRVALWGLYCTAWHLHRAYYGGDDEGPRAVRGEIERLLAQDLKERWEFGLLQTEALAAEVLRFWEGAGPLDTYRLAGQEWLAFRHLTFQEYGAARALAEMYENDADGLWQCLSPHLLRPQWAGVIPLTLAHLSEARATTLVKRLLKANKRDRSEQRPLFLAAAALAEGAEIALAPHWQVVDVLLNLARTRGWLEWHQRAGASDAVSALGRLVEDGYAAAGLRALARDGAIGGGVRAEAVEALSKLGHVEEAAAGLLAMVHDNTMIEEAVVKLCKLGRVGDLLALARDEKVDAEVRERVAYELCDECGRTDEAVPILLALALDEKVEADVRHAAAFGVNEFGQADQATQAWRALAHGEKVKAYVRERAAFRLLQWEQPDDLLSLALDEKVDGWTRGQAVEALGRLMRVGELLVVARDEKVRGRMREIATEALSKLGRADEAAQAWRALALDEKVDAWVRVRAAEALGQLGGADEAAQAWLALARDDEAAQAFLALTRDEQASDFVRWRAREVLGKLGRTDELSVLARDEQVEAQERMRGAEALGQLGQADEAAEALGRLWRADEMAKLLLALARHLAVDDQEWLWVIEALEELGRADEAAKLLLALARDRSVKAALRATEALEKLECADHLLALVPDRSVKAAVRATEALEKLERADHLLALVRDRSVKAAVRERAAEALEKLERADDLLALARDPTVEAWVREQAAEALRRLGRAEEAAEILLALTQCRALGLLALAQDRAVGARLREWAAADLGKLRQATPEVVAGLRALAEEPGTPESVRRAAREALKRLEEVRELDI